METKTYLINIEEEPSYDIPCAVCAICGVNSELTYVGDGLFEGILIEGTDKTICGMCVWPEEI